MTGANAGGERMFGPWFSMTLVEREIRWAKIRQAMEHAGLDTLLVVSDGHIERGGSIRYIADVNTRGMYVYVIFPLKGSPVAINIRGILNRKGASWIEDVRNLPLRGGWVPESEPYGAFIAEIIREWGVEKGTLGVEGDFLPTPVYQRLVRELPETVLMETNIIHDLKMVKSAEEIRLVEQGVEIVDKAFETCQEVARPGMTWNEVSSMVCKTLYDWGMEGIGGFPLPRSTKIMQPGDTYLLFPEIQAPGGYWIQFGRLFSFGEPDTDIREAWDLSIEAQKRATGKLRPGNTGADVMAAIDDTLRGTKYQADLRGSGHGVALDVLEKPFISHDDKQVIKPGMIVTIHPILLAPAPYPVLVADTYLVTETEPRKLSRISPEIRIV
jgi:Xaa-Pro aminopeptidase